MEWSINKVESHLWTLDIKVEFTEPVPPLLLMSDEHWDNQHCDRELLKDHHDWAVAMGSPIFKFGDTFCAMQGKWDKRADQQQLREEHRGNNYFDRLVQTASEWYGPYAKNIALISTGNHESSIQTHHQTNLIDRLGAGLWGAGFESRVGSVWGFVIIRVEWAGCGVSKVLHFHHGYGGGGEVTRGMIDNSRTRGQYLADVYYSGHIHRRNEDENSITMVDRHNVRVIRSEQLFLRGASYKHEVDGWHADKGRAARPVGGWWLFPKLVETRAGGHRKRLMEFVEMRATRHRPEWGK